MKKRRITVTTPKKLAGFEQARYIGARALLHLEVFPSKVPGAYRCAVYEWFDRKPLFASGTDSSLDGAKGEAVREAGRLAGFGGDQVDWEPDQSA